MFGGGLVTVLVCVSVCVRVGVMCFSGSLVSEFRILDRTLA